MNPGGRVQANPPILSPLLSLRFTTTGSVVSEEPSSTNNSQPFILIMPLTCVDLVTRTA